MTASGRRRAAERQIGPDGLRVVAPDSTAPDLVVLAIDTSSKLGGVALLRGRELAGEEVWQAGGKQTVQVLPSAARLCDRAGIALADVGLVVVATGPGSFTGLRVGVSIGKGLVAALGVPLVGVPTLDVLAYQNRHVPGQLMAVVEAGRGQLYVGTYRSSARGLWHTGSFAVLTGEELVAQLRDSSTATFVCGDLDQATAEGLAAGGRVRLASPVAGARRPAFLAELGHWRLQTQGADDAAALQPLYLRRT